MAPPLATPRYFAPLIVPPSAATAWLSMKVQPMTTAVAPTPAGLGLVSPLSVFQMAPPSTKAAPTLPTAWLARKELLTTVRTLLGALVMAPPWLSDRL